MKKKNQMFLNFVTSIISMIVSLGISFVLTPYLIENLGKEAYAFYPIANNFVSYMTIITMTLNSMASRFITIEISRQNKKKAQEYFSSVLGANIVLASLLLIPMICIVWGLDRILDIPMAIVCEIKIMFALIFSSMLVNLLASVYGVSAFAKNRLDIRSESDIVQNVLKGLLYIALFSIFKPRMIFVGLVALSISVVNMIVQVVVTRKLLPDYKIARRYINVALIKELGYAGIWNSINALGSTLLLSVGLLIANIRIGAEASGTLSIVQVLPNFMTTVIITVYSVFLPYLTRIYAQEGETSLNLYSELLRSQKILGYVATLPCLLIILFGKEFFDLWVPEENSKYLQILSVITVMPLLIHSNMWTVYGMTVVLNKVREPSLILIIIGVFNVIITNLWLGQQADIVIIPLVSSCLNILYYSLLIPYYVGRQIGHYKELFLHLLRIGCFSLLFIFVGKLLKQTLEIKTWIAFFAYGAFFAVIGYLMAIPFIFTKQDLKNIIFRERIK